MRNLVSLIFTLLSVICPVRLLSNPSIDDHVTQITLLGSSINSPRGVSKSTIECYYQNGCVYLNFSEEVGNVEVYVYNTETGTAYYNSGNSRFGNISVEVSQSSGNYLVIINIESLMLYGYYTVV